jgi:hypothetical protein
MKDGINKVTNLMNTIKSETESKLNIFRAKVEVEGRMLRVNIAMNKLQRKLDLLIDCVVNAQKGGIATSNNLPSSIDGNPDQERFRLPKGNDPSISPERGFSTFAYKVI